MAGRKCKVCVHPERAEIEARVVSGEQKASISRDFAFSADSLSRHVKNHMGEALARTEAVKAIVVRESVLEAAAESERRRQNGGRLVMAELERTFERVNLMFDACDDWLRDPRNPARYFLGPRADEIDVAYMAITDGGFEKRVDSLQNLLGRVNGAVEAGVVNVGMVREKHADPRELLLKTAVTLQKSMTLLARIRDSMAKTGAGLDAATTEAWVGIRTVILEELADHPDLQERIAVRLEALERGNS